MSAPRSEERTLQIVARARAGRPRFTDAEITTAHGAGTSGTDAWRP